MSRIGFEKTADESNWTHRIPLMDMKLMQQKYVHSKSFSWKSVMGYVSKVDYDKALITDSDSDNDTPSSNNQFTRKKLAPSLMPYRRKYSIIPFTEREIHNEIRSIIRVLADSHHRRVDIKTSLTSKTAEMDWIFRFDDFISILRMFTSRTESRRFIKNLQVIQTLEDSLIHWMNMRPRLSAGIPIFDFVSWLYRSISVNIADDFGTFLFYDEELIDSENVIPDISYQSLIADDSQDFRHTSEYHNWIPNFSESSMNDTSELIFNRSNEGFNSQFEEA